MLRLPLGKKRPAICANRKKEREKDEGIIKQKGLDGTKNTSSNISCAHGLLLRVLFGIFCAVHPVRI